MMNMNTLFCLLLITIVVTDHQSSAFMTTAPFSSVSPPIQGADTNTSLNGFFDAAIKNAFGNEELGAKQNAGISGAVSLVNANVRSC